MQSGLSAILRHKKEVQKLEPHRHFPHLTPESNDIDILRDWKINGLTVELLLEGSQLSPAGNTTRQGV